MSDARSIEDLREDYRLATLEPDQCPDGPLPLFQQWFDEARASQVREPNAMTLCTVDENARPAGRMVLLKGLTDDGFLFYTNYESRKGRHLDGRPWASLVFWWEPLERQVRVEGAVRRADPAVCDAYFASRPRASQLGAWASPQSAAVASREELDAAFERVSERFDGEIPRPPHWGGYLVVPERVEFWQGRTGRLHDRVEYRLHGGTWQRRRLAP